MEKEKKIDEYVVKNRGLVTFHKALLFAQCPEAYKKVYIDEVDTSMIKKSTAFEKGTMVDQFILSPDKFNENYVIFEYEDLKENYLEECKRRGIPVVEKKSKEQDADTKNSLKSKLFGNKEVLTNSEVEMVQGIKRELERQPLFDLHGPYQHQVELIVEFKGLKLKGTLDRLSLEKKVICDLKTSKDVIRTNYGTIQIEYDLITNDKYGYLLQLSWYAMLVYIHTGEWFDGVIDAVKPSGNFAYAQLFVPKKVLQAIIQKILFPIIDKLVEAHNTNTFEYKGDGRELINNIYYPILDCAIQKDKIEIIPQLENLCLNFSLDDNI